MDAHILDRPFYFIIVLWGVRFRDYFLDLCLPSLLSAHNCPALATIRRSKFLICTLPEDWEAITAAPIFGLLERYVDPVFVEIPPQPSEVPACVHMGIGHRRALQMAFEAKSYAFVLTPDSIFSEGTVEYLQDLAKKGVELVLVPALRFAEEPAFDRLQALGVEPRGRKGAAEPITLTSTQLVGAALPSMHSETLTFEWDATCFHLTPSAAWWRVSDDGILVHSLSWAAPLIDFGAVSRHDTSTFDNWTFDGDYIYNNLSSIRRIHRVLDSDEMFILGWSPLSERPCDVTPRPYLQKGWVGGFARKARFCSWFYSRSLDPFRRANFFFAARWHASPLNKSWEAVERRALRTLLACVAPQPRAEGSEKLDAPVDARDWASFFRSGAYSRHLYALLVPLTRTTILLQALWARRSAAIHQLSQLLKGDRNTRLSLTWRIRRATHYLFGYRFMEPPPIPDLVAEKRCCVRRQRS